MKCILVEKVTEYVATKQDEVEGYETVLANMSTTLAERDSQIGACRDQIVCECHQIKHLISEEYTSAVGNLQNQLTECESRVSQLEEQSEYITCVVCCLLYTLS